jgi:hypothetical protein
MEQTEINIQYITWYRGEKLKGYKQIQVAVRMMSHYSYHEGLNLRIYLPISGKFGSENMFPRRSSDL